MTIGNGLQPPGNGGCKVGNVYIATTFILLFLTEYPDTGVADGFAIFTALGQWSERFTDYSEPAFIVGSVAVEMLIDDVFDKDADAITGPAEESCDALDTVKRVVADGYLMLVVLAEFNRGKEGGAVIFEFALALLGGGTG